MSDTPAPSSGHLERQCLEALKALGKALGQMALYKVGHPAVAETLAVARENLGEALALVRDGELVVSLDHDKLIANGRVIGLAAQLPNSMAVFYARFKLTSLTFRLGVTHEELAAFCELASLRADAAAATDPGAFLNSRGVTHLSLNEAIYLKAGQPGAGEGGFPEGGAASGKGMASSAAGEDAIRHINSAIESGSLERTLAALVDRSVPDPTLRQKVIAQVLRLLENDIAKRVEEVTLPLRREKKKVENDSVRTTSVLQNMVEGVVVVDDQGKILMMNPAAEQIYGDSLAHSAGKEITHKASEQFVVTLAEELSSPNDRDIAKGVKIQGMEDTRKTLRASSAVVQTEAGQVVGVVTALPDAAKHRELHKIQRDFVAHVTHELRAPLSSIRAALEIIQSDFSANMENEESRMLATALKNSDRLADMINGILDFSKIESGQMTVYPKPVDPAAVAKEAVDSLQPWAQKKKITLDLIAPKGLALVDSDAPRTIQVLVNLLSNAIKFTPSGGRITVTLTNHGGGPSPMVQFAVADTGPGISQSEQTRVFEKFAQISAGEAHVGGTGLGLSIAKALVQLQKGQMRVDSVLGQGTTFSFTLPVNDGQILEATTIRTKATVVDRRPFWKKLLGLK